jgi:hypothetical protein
LSNEDDEKRKSYADNIDRVDTWATSAAENGLFKDGEKDSSKSLDPILEKLKEARESLKCYNFIQCSDALSKAADHYFRAVDSASISWRFLNIYAIHLWIYLVTFLAIIFIFYYFDLDHFLHLRAGVTQLSIDAAAWGVIGSLLRGIWWLWKNVNDREYRKTWIVWFISTPFIGGILGAIVYFIITAGLLIVTTDDLSNRNNFDEITNPMVVIVFAALAGFNWDWAIDQFNKLRERL